jgi:hypothetical protein
VIAMRATSATASERQAAPERQQAGPGIMYDPCEKPSMSGRTLTNGLVLSAAIYVVIGGVIWLAFHS